MECRVVGAGRLFSKKDDGWLKGGNWEEVRRINNNNYN